MNTFAKTPLIYTLITMFALVIIILFSGTILAQDGQAVKDIETLCKQDQYKDSSFCVGPNDPSDNTVIDTITVIINALAFIGGILAVLYVIWGGIKYITSSGVPDKAASARKTIIYALIGIVVIVFSRTLILWILTKLL